MRLLGAVRVSRHRGEADPSTSPDRQQETIKNYAHSENHEIVDWAMDLNQSAITLAPFDRQALGPWLADRRGEYDGIIWAKLDRAVRKIKDLHELVSWAVQHKKALIFASGPGAGLRLDMRADDTFNEALAHVILTLLAFAAQMEGDAIRERNKGTRAYLREVGRWPGGMYPYHTIPVKHENGWILARNPDTWPVLEDIIKRVLNKDSKLQIAQDLNNAGVPSPREYRLLTSSSPKILTAPTTGRIVFDANASYTKPKKGEKQQSRYITLYPEDGSAPLQMSVFPKHANLAIRDDEFVLAGTRLTKPILWNSNTIAAMCRDVALLGQHTVGNKLVLGKDGMPIRRVEALITDRAVWNKLQIILTETTRGAGVPKTDDGNIFLGIAFCSICGAQMHRRYLKAANLTYYGCRSAWGGIPRQSKNDRCRAPSIRNNQLEEAVDSLLLSQIGELEVMERQVIPATPHLNELREAELALAQCIDESAGKAPAVRKIWAAKIAQLETRIETLTALGDTESDRIELVPTGKTWESFWPHASTKEKHNMLMASGIKVMVGKSDVFPALAATRGLNDLLSEIETDSGHQVTILFEGGLVARLLATQSYQ